MPAPTVTSINPTSGPTAGGTSVTITGTNLSGATAVDFGTGNAADHHRDSATSITATSPAGSGTVDVTVTTTGGTSATSPADLFTYVPAPTVTSINPTTGPAGGGTSVTITGTNLIGATAVDFGTGNAADHHRRHRDPITATSPGRQRHGGRDGHHRRRHLRHLVGRSVHLHARPDGDLDQPDQRARPAVAPA